MESNVNNRIYDELAETWWDEDKFLHLLKVMVNPWRVPYFKNALVDRYGQDLSQLRLLDIGCGGGVLTEEFREMGCQVTGIDISLNSIAIARNHALVNNLSIDYLAGSGTGLSFAGETFDAVSCCDVLEHIRDWRQVIAETRRVLKPGGIFLFDTINRTLQTRVQYIFALQEFPLTRLMPANTHVWEMFITPEELGFALRQHGLSLENIQGGKVAQTPFTILWSIWRQKQGKITFAELGRRLQIKVDKDLSLSYLGYAHKTV